MKFFKAIVGLAITAVGVAATTVLWLLQLGDFHARTKSPGYAALAVLGFIAVGQAGRLSVRQYRLARSAELTRASEEVLSQALRDLIKLDGLTLENVGISAWLVQRPLRRPWQARMVRVARRRLAVSVASRIVWTKGKGIIGRCWEIENVVAGETATSWAGLERCSKREWRQIKNPVRLRLRHREFRRICGKYQGAVAVPIVGWHDEFLGCISVDVRRGTPFESLNRQEVVDIAAQAGSTIANLLALVSRWVYVHGG